MTVEGADAVLDLRFMPQALLTLVPRREFDGMTGRSLLRHFPLVSPGKLGPLHAHHDGDQHHHEQHQHQAHGGHCAAGVLPLPQDEGLGRADAHKQRIAVDNVRRDHPGRCVLRARHPRLSDNGRPIAGRENLQGHRPWKDLAETVRCLGKAGQQGSVAAQQADRAFGVGLHALVVACEELGLDAGQRQSQDLSVAALDLAGEIEGPPSGAAVLHRCTDHDVEFRVGHVRLDVVTVRQVDRRCRPGPRKVENVAVEGDDGGDVDLRQPLCSVAQHPVDVGTRHQLPELVLGGDPAIADLFGDAAQHDVGRRQCLVGMLGQQQGQAAQ